MVEVRVQWRIFRQRNKKFTEGISKGSLLKDFAAIVCMFDAPLPLQTVLLFLYIFLKELYTVKKKLKQKIKLLQRGPARNLVLSVA